MRDLTGASPAAISAERASIPREGIGAAILNCQEPDGSWRHAGEPAWLSTLFTLQLLRATGIDPAEPVVESAMTRLADGLRWNDQDGFWELRSVESGGNTFFEGEVEPCINSGALAIGSCFGHPAESLAQRLMGEQLSDGGWNCEAPKSVRSSFHTTICVLEGLLQFERAVGSAPEIIACRRRGEEYLLQRALFRRFSTGEVADAAFLKFAFPPRYHYDVLRALNYLRDSGVEYEARFEEALRGVQSRRQADGRWLLDDSHDEGLAVPAGEVVGEPSRWNTLRALRVLRWYEGQG